MLRCRDRAVSRVLARVKDAGNVVPAWDDLIRTRNDVEAYEMRGARLLLQLRPRRGSDMTLVSR